MVQPLAQAFVSTMEPGFHRSYGHVENFGGFMELIAFHVVKDDDFALVGGQLFD